MKNKVAPEFLLCLMALNITYGQASRVLTEADYRHAASMLGPNVNKLTDNDIALNGCPTGGYGTNQ